MGKMNKLFVICVRHSKPGTPTPAVKKKIKGIVAICPGCIEEGGEIRKQMAIEATRREEERKNANPEEAPAEEEKPVGKGLRLLKPEEEPGSVESSGGDEPSGEGPVPEGTPEVGPTDPPNQDK